VHFDRNLEYEAALLEIHVPGTWFTIGEPVTISLASTAAGAGTETTLQPAYYSTIDELVDVINEKMRCCFEHCTILNQSIRSDQSGLSPMRQQQQQQQQQQHYVLTSDEDEQEEEEEEEINMRINRGTHMLEIRNFTLGLRLEISGGQVSRIL
jgi:hypothetical protein